MCQGRQTCTLQHQFPGDINSQCFIAMSHNTHRNYSDLNNKVGMLTINQLMEKWMPGSHKVSWFYSVSAAVSSTRQSMSDQSGESIALTDAFLMLPFPRATADAICLSWASLCFMDMCWIQLGWKSEHKLKQPCPTAKRGPMTAFKPEGFLKLSWESWKKKGSAQ